MSTGFSHLLGKRDELLDHRSGLNGAVLVPIYEVPEDETALKQLRSIFPDREVIGINCRPLILQHRTMPVARPN